MPYVYILTNKNNSTLYVGVTSNLSRRIDQHLANGNQSTFVKRYNLKKLVYVEPIEDMYEAIAYEKRLKKWRRDWKNALISVRNPEWIDLGDIISF